MRTTTTFGFVLAATGAVYAQSGYPAYIGELLIQPALSTAKCLTAASDLSNNSDVDIQECTGRPNQKWTFVRTPGSKGGPVRIFGKKCLEAPESGSTITVETCHADNERQQFFYNYFDYRLMLKDTKKCVELSGGAHDGKGIHLVDCEHGYSASRIWNTGYMAYNQPYKSEDNQYGHNRCTEDSQGSSCQTAWINSATDFCLWGPPTPNSLVGDTEREQVAWCLKPGHGTRLIPNGTLKGVHFVKTKDYVQVTGVGDFTNMNIREKDEGGELDPHGADGNGNPIGGLVYGNTFGRALQYHEWTNFMSAKEFCFRACTGANAARNCQHIYDVMGCEWNMPASYDEDVFEECLGDNDEPMGVYGSSTWRQGQEPTPSAHPPAKSSQCTTYATVTSTPMPRMKNRMV